MAYIRPYVGKRGAIRRKRSTRYKSRVRPRRMQVTSRPTLPLGGMPKRKLCRLKYVQQITLDPSSLAPIAAHEFRANSLFDPDYSGTGHQPRGFDQLMVYYDHYRVLGSKITVTVASHSTTHAVPAYAGILLADTVGAAVSYGSSESLLESRVRSSGLITQAGVANQGMGRKTVSKTFSAKKFFGPEAKYASKYQGTAASNPVEDAVFNVFACNINGNDPGETNYLVTIEYIAMFSEPRTLPGS